MKECRYIEENRSEGGFSSSLPRIADHDDGETKKKERLRRLSSCALSGEERRKSGKGGREVESARCRGGWGGGGRASDALSLSTQSQVEKMKRIEAQAQ